MGLGDNLIATGLARGASVRGKRIAFGDGRKIMWDKHSPMIFWKNPNIAEPGHERARDIEWVNFCRGNRIYNRGGSGRWIWNYEFKVKPGQMFFSQDENKWSRQYGNGLVVIEPNVPIWKSVAPNKQWPVDRYEAVAAKLLADGHHVVQLAYGAPNRIKSASLLPTKSFRQAIALLRQAALYIGPEGGLHHGAAAVGIAGVVLFGGFIPPQVTGYDTHTNLTGMAAGGEACGSFNRCEHCLAAMRSISVEEVYAAATRHLAKVAA